MSMAKSKTSLPRLSWCCRKYNQPSSYKGSTMFCMLWSLYVPASCCTAEFISSSSRNHAFGVRNKIQRNRCTNIWKVSAELSKILFRNLNIFGMKKNGDEQLKSLRTCLVAKLNEDCPHTTTVPDLELSRPRTRVTKGSHSSVVWHLPSGQMVPHLNDGIYS